MWLAQGTSALVLFFSPRTDLASLWRALAALFLVQCAAGAGRILSNAGPWAGFLRRSPAAAAADS